MTPRSGASESTCAERQRLTVKQFEYRAGRGNMSRGKGTQVFERHFTDHGSVSGQEGNMYHRLAQSQADTFCDPRRPRSIPQSSTRTSAPPGEGENAIAHQCVAPYYETPFRAHPPLYSFAIGHHTSVAHVKLMQRCCEPRSVIPALDTKST